MCTREQRILNYAGRPGPVLKGSDLTKHRGSAPRQKNGRSGNDDGIKQHIRIKKTGRRNMYKEVNTSVVDSRKYERIKQHENRDRQSINSRFVRRLQRVLYEVRTERTLFFLT